MNGTLWDSTSHVLFVALLVVALAALHTSKNWTQHKQRNATATLNAKREKNSYITLYIRSKPSGSETQPPPATYAVYPSSQVTLSKQITLMQETQTVNSKQHTEDATPAEVAPHSPSSHHTDRHSTQPSNT